MTSIPALDSFGTLLQVGDGEVVEAFTTVARVADITGPQRDRNFHDATSHDSPEGYQEMSPGLKTPGVVSFPTRYLPANLTHLELDELYESGELRNFRIVTPARGDQPSTTRQFAGYVKSLGDSFPVDGLAGRDVGLQISGPVNPVEAS
jgi:hypothetical protein